MLNKIFITNYFAYSYVINCMDFLSDDLKVVYLT